MKIAQLVFNSFSENTYVVYDETNEAIIIDPGMSTPEEEQKFIEFIEKNNLNPTKIVNTHCHIDHILGVDFLKTQYKIKLFANKDDEYLLENAIETAELFGIDLAQSPTIDEYVCETDTIQFGKSSLKIIEVPGHTSGHLAFYSEEDKFVLTGDVLFKDTIGRTDLPGGNLDQLLLNIKTKLLPLGDDFNVLPGHGPNTNIGTERINNPFL